MRQHAFSRIEIFISHLYLHSQLLNSPQHSFKRFFHSFATHISRSISAGTVCSQCKREYRRLLLYLFNSLPSFVFYFFFFFSRRKKNSRGKTALRTTAKIASDSRQPCGSVIGILNASRATRAQAAFFMGFSYHQVYHIFPLTLQVLQRSCEKYNIRSFIAATLVSALNFLSDGDFPREETSTLFLPRSRLNIFTAFPVLRIAAPFSHFISSYPPALFSEN